MTKYLSGHVKDFGWVLTRPGLRRPNKQLSLILNRDRHIFTPKRVPVKLIVESQPRVEKVSDE